MSILSNRRDAFDLQDEVAALRREIASLGRNLSKGGARTASHARAGSSELYSEIADALTAALPALRAPARRAKRAVEDHPDRVVAIAGLVILGAAAAFVWGRRR